MRTITVPLKLIDLQDDGFHLLVEIVVFGKKLLAVVDTGASRSVFDIALIRQHIDITETLESQATTLFSTTSTLQATLPVLKIGRLKIKDYYAVGLELAGVNETYNSLGHPTIAAIIGSDIFLRYQATINFKKLNLYLYDD